MELEAVGGVSVGDVRFEIRWQIDDIDSSKWTFLWTDTASNAKTLGDEGDFRFWSNFDAQSPTANHWTRLLTLLSAFLSNDNSV